MPVDQPNPFHVFVEKVIQDIALLPARDNAEKYDMVVSIDELRAILARRLWALKHSIRIVDAEFTRLPDQVEGERPRPPA